MNNEPEYVPRPNTPERGLSVPGRERRLPANDNVLVERMLDNQTEELRIREVESNNEEAQMQRMHEYAMKALDVQADDRENHRRYSKTIGGRALWIILSLVLIVAAFFGYALFLGKEQVVLEIVKASLYIVSGGSGGYFAGLSKGNKNKSDSRNSERDSGDDEE